MKKELKKWGFDTCDNCKKYTLYFHEIDKYFECSNCKIRYKIEYPRFTCDTNRVVLKNPKNWINMNEYMNNETKKRILIAGVIQRINDIINNNMFKDWEIDKLYEWFKNSKNILNDKTINNIQQILTEYEGCILDLDNIKFKMWK